MSATQRPARPGEVCSCGRPAVVVYLTEAHGPVPYCGIPDGGRVEPEPAEPNQPQHRRRPPMIRRMTRLSTLTAVLAAVLLAAGCGHSSGSSGAGGGAPSVAELASRLGCAHVEQATSVLGVREEASCDLGGDNLTIDTFSSNAQRDAVLKAFGTLAGGVPVIGDRWIVSAPTQAAAEAVRAKLGGQIR